MIPRTHLFSVAVEDYQDPRIPPVRFAADDARRFVSTFNGTLANPGESVSMVDSEATMATVRSRFKRFLSKIGKEDRLVFHFCGQALLVDAQNHLLTHDTIADDPGETSLPLGYLLDQISGSGCSQVVIFLDGVHGLMQLTGEARVSPFDGAELVPFCKAGSDRVAFLACSPGETSARNLNLKSGIWHHAICAALKGTREKQNNEAILSADSLQKYLVSEVAINVRSVAGGTTTQTPLLLPAEAPSLPIVDFKYARGEATSANANFIVNSSLSGVIIGRVRELSGYRKPSQPLGRHSQWERSFVESSGEGEVSAQATAIHERIRSLFGYKRKETSFAPDGALASISTPDFDVSISLGQDPVDAEQYLMRTDVTSFRRPDVVDQPEFLEIFGEYCNRVVFDLANPLDIETAIDEIEAIESFADSIDYDPQCTYLTLRPRDAGLVIHATESQVVFSVDGSGDLEKLLRKTRETMAILAANKVLPGLPAS